MTSVQIVKGKRIKRKREKHLTKFPQAAIKFWRLFSFVILLCNFSRDKTMVGSRLPMPSNANPEEAQMSLLLSLSLSVEQS